MMRIDPFAKALLKRTCCKITTRYYTIIALKKSIISYKMSSYYRYYINFMKKILIFCEKIVDFKFFSCYNKLTYNMDRYTITEVTWNRSSI